MTKEDGKQKSAHIAACIGISELMVKKYKKKKKKHGLLTRIGSNKTGYWKTNL